MSAKFSDASAMDKLVDAYGNSHRPVSAGETVRIVCLVPSITELLCDLGLQQSLVGRTGFCIHPKSIVHSIPKIGGTKDVNIEKIRKLAPTHLIVNIDENEKPTVELLAEFIPHVVVTHPIEPRDNLALFRLLGAIFNVNQKAEELCQQFEHQWALLNPDVEVRQVLYCIWKDPWMTVSRDTYIAHLLQRRGYLQWQSSKSSQRYPVFEWDDVSLQHVDCVLLSTEPYSFNVQDAKQLQLQIQKPVILVDGEMLSWYGSRSIQGMRYLRELAI
ncbi:helical backbone metal receptor [Undibacterium sp. Di24W]|uniref:helical backbone metal receptor n=1 Tax=Undibacterium sp. Di24W TaxID=3413033 RepID=UPI003BF40C9C